jgi:hypothetical protein
LDENNLLQKRFIFSSASARGGVTLGCGSACMVGESDSELEPRGTVADLPTAFGENAKHAKH